MVSPSARFRMVAFDFPRTILDRCRQWLQDGTYAALPGGLREYLVGRLTADAAERHIAAGLVLQP
jgi:hypothetical protein